MKLKILAWFLLPAGALLAAGQSTAPDAKPDSVASPDGRLVVDFRLNSAGAPRYAIRLAGQPVLQESRLGLVREDADFSQGLRLAGQSPTSIVLGGISRTFQNIRLFSSMTVLENVQTALHTASDYSLLAAFVQWPWTVWAAEKRLRDSAMELLGVVDLEEYANRVAGTLPYGLQRKLEVARALALRPKLLLLDEPAAGMNPQESLELVELVKRIHERMKLTIVLIEHHMDVVMNVCERIAVLNFGKRIAEGTPDEIQSNPLVLEAYLGQREEYAALG